MRWILWGEGKPIPGHVWDELERMIRCILEVA
jgi:hypothetical protein